ncbi:MAG: hypothetical protein ACT4P7_08220 [Gemmatimonadaceae bacterium]
MSLLPPAFQFPEVTAAAAHYGDIQKATTGFRRTPWTLEAAFRTSDGTRGRLETGYLDERPPAAEGPFFAEERHLIDSVSEMLTSVLDRRLADVALRKSEERLQLAEAAAGLGVWELDLHNQQSRLVAGDGTNDRACPGRISRNARRRTGARASGRPTWMKDSAYTGEKY